MRKPNESSAAGIATPALRVFMEIAEAWKLTHQEQAGILGVPVGVAQARLEAFEVNDLLPETLERISYLLGIYRALHTLFPNEQQANTWVRRPNTGAPFNGDTALRLMCSGRIGELATVREYLEAQGISAP